MELTTFVLGISSFAWVVMFCTGKATLNLPTSVKCGDQVELKCISTGCYVAYLFSREGDIIYNHIGPQTGTDPDRYSATVTSASQVLLTISNIQLSDAGAYQCSCGFDGHSAQHTLRYECNAALSTAAVTSDKKLKITMDMLYPRPSSIATSLINPTSKVPGTYTCGSSPTINSHFICTWNSTASLPDGTHSYTITVTTETQASPMSGSFKIVTPTSPTISNLSTIPNNRQVVRGIQDTPLTIQCVSSGGIPAPTLAWYRSNTNAYPLAQSTTADHVPQSDGTYTVTLIHKFTPVRRDDMTPFLCRVFYPGATTGASPDPSSASAILYLDLKPDKPTVSQTGEAASGGSMTLRCTSNNGRPAPSVTWFYQGQPFTPTTNLSYDPTSETYTVMSVLERPVNATDNGHTVTCVVSHTTLYIPLNATINVDVKFGSPPGTMAISGNKPTPATGTNQTRLNCTSGSSNPASNITWYNGSDVIPNKDGYTRWPGNNNGVISSNILTITPTRYMDGDRVTCRSDNGYGSDSKSVDLDVLYSCLIQTLPNVTAIEGEPDVTLTCSASSKPPANFTWYKGNMVLASGIGSLAGNTFSYVIPHVDRTYAGSYKCHAGNNVGSPNSKDAYLIVKYPPSVAVSATTSIPYAVTCTAHGYPDIYEYKKWAQIWPGYGPVATIPFNQTSLTLASDTYERSGVYVCGVSNGVAVYGTDKVYMYGNVTVIIPAPPVLMDPKPDVAKFRVAGRLGQVAGINIKYWSNVNDSVVRCFKIEEDTQSSSSVCSVMMTETEVELPVFNHMIPETGTLATIKIPIISLENLTDYEIVVTNRVGKSVLGITIVPEVVGPPAAPTVTDTIAVTPGQVILRVLPGFHGGYNQTLVVQISTDLVTWINNTSLYIGLDTQVTEVQLINLKGNALHYVQMFSYNSAGRSNSSSETLNFTTTEDTTLRTPPTAAWIGGTVGTTCALVVAAVIVVFVLRNTKVGLVARDKRCLTNDQDNSEGVVECAMYVSAGNVQPGPSIRDEYSTPQKKGRADQSCNEYSVVTRKKKGGNTKGKAGQQVEGLRHVPQVSETEFGYQATSNRNQIPKNVNDDGLIYADLEFDSTASYDVIHGLDDVTIYEEIDFSRTAEPLPESDDESIVTK